MVLNRRKFFKWLGVGTAVAAVAPYVDLPAVPVCVADPLLGVTIPADAIVDTYAEYCNFSSFVIAAAIDDVVADSAAELAHRRGLLLNDLVQHV